MGKKPLGYLAVLAAMVLSVAITVFALDLRAPQDDARQFARMAYSLAETGTLSTDDPRGAAPPAPSARREPLYPAILALSLRLFAPRDLQEHGARCFTQDALCPETMFVLRLPNILLHIVLALSTGWSAWAVSKNRVACVAAIAITALFSGFVSESNILYAETLGALGVVLFSTLLFRALPSKSGGGWGLRGACLCGLAFGLLILSKAVFFYLLALFIFAALLFIVAATAKKVAWHVPARLATIAIAALCVILPWMARNAAIGEGWRVSGRGEEVLAIRASYDSMPWSDVPAAFAAAIPVVGQYVVRRIFGSQVWERFDRENPVGYYARAKNRTSVAHEKAAAKNLSLKRAALEIFIENPAKHAALSAAFALSGAFPQVYMRQQKLPPALVFPSLLAGILFVPAMIGLAVFCAAKSKGDIVLFLVPALFSFCFHAALTHYIPRYSMMLYPVFIVCLVCLATFLLQERAHAKTA